MQIITYVESSGSALTGTCIGVDLDAGMYLAPHAPRLATLLAAIIELLLRPYTSPFGLAAVLGVVQWFDQLDRPLFSVLDKAYGFTRLPLPNTLQKLPSDVQYELLQVLALAPAWEADLTRPWLA